MHPPKKKEKIASNLKLPMLSSGGWQQGGREKGVAKAKCGLEAEVNGSR